MKDKMGKMGGMISKSLVASGDGGVIVLSGNALLKYDADLNLVKQVDLPVPAGMNEMTPGMKEKCAACMGMAKDAADAPAADAGAPENHEAHH